MFKLKGFDEVSLRDIADKVGIQQSTIYNHFKSKQEILDTIYNYYCYYHKKDRPSLEDMEHVLRNASLNDIILYVRYDYDEEYREKLSDITKIIFHRLAIDDRANDIGKSIIVDSGIKYVEDVFNLAIKIGRLAPFDVHAMAVFINSIRIFTLYNWIVAPSPENMLSIWNDEKALYDYATRFLIDLKPPVKND